ncbi:DNA polymerase epsilon catalytic subunit A-like [Watersipora subatra]|uniref:DNA polymerase epsilon catalytic subunit A-like n=1 Tax=Watersipora subatra TaxID=2589382 RepID=UPI00355C34CF
MVLENTGKYVPEYEQKDRDGDDGVDKRLEAAIINDEIDLNLGFERYKEPQERIGWLVNFHPSDVQDEEKRLVSAVDFYFIEEDGDRFKVTVPYKPYFYIACQDKSEKEVGAYLMKKFSGKIASIEFIQKEDLDLHNHLIGLKRTYVKLLFLTVDNLSKVKREIFSAVKKNQAALKKQDALAEAAGSITGADGRVKKRPVFDLIDNIIDIREHDVSYHCRVSIDLKVNVGRWYAVKGRTSSHVPSITIREDLLERPDAIVMAFDIETTKLPLKFPDSASDQIMMISYMIDGQGYLITNREIVSEDIEDFEYTPKPEYEGPFIIFNEPDESSLIRKFIDHILEIKPHIISTYNGDSFDWPFVEARAGFHGIDLYRETGFKKDSMGEYKSRPIAHLDCYKWVKRDSYLPVGSQNLKAVAKAKLRYDPVELDPEEMCRMANEQPQVLATYSVSDSVATYYIYMKYVDPFIFALCTIIPLEPDEVLRKGSGTLCEALLMVQAYDANIIYPNKHDSELNKLTDDGHVLDSETYVGGHVEAIESGVFRSDIPMKFRLQRAGVQELLDDAERTLKFVIETEEKIPLETVENFDETLADIKGKLVDLRDNLVREENPILYHLDVGAMYPNIILTNRLQPPALVDEASCAACDFNKPRNRCQRKMPWMWRGELMSANRPEFVRIQQQLEGETFPPDKNNPNGPARAFYQLNRDEKAAAEKKRLAEYCKKSYKKIHFTRLEKRVSTVCQRENSFYVDTVRSFRDRRYEFKGLTKVWNRKLAEAKASGDAAEIKKAGSMAVLYDSLQLAHKCILNSFYGYVMRKGARWYSMEMAGIVCHTGANIIKRAREITESIGRPLELDTDGIWAALPASFPENYTIKSSHPKKPKVTISYPGAMLNLMVKDLFTNDQYNDLVDNEQHKYEVRSENSIFFEVDGPYLAMILPASKEEGKKLKKRYAVFNPDKSLAELKGFEIKRRGELQLVKKFQSSVFDAFLRGKTTQEAYASAAVVADYWIDVLYSKAANMPDSELFELISENRSMSRKLEDYGSQKSTSISTARRLAEFLGDQMVKDAGLSCRFIISKKPEGSPVTERAIPLAIFQCEVSLRKHYLRKWLKAPGLQDFNIRNILDWEYYLERLGGCIQKIITIPAALQGVSNPVPRIAHPDWLHKKMLEKNDVYKQRKITDVFSFKAKSTNIEEEENIDPSSDVMDIEEVVAAPEASTSKVVVTKKRPREEKTAVDVMSSWRDQLGPVPRMGTTKEEIRAWLAYQKKKWAIQLAQKRMMRKRRRTDDADMAAVGSTSRVSIGGKSLSGFMQQTANSILSVPWQILQICETAVTGKYKAWILIHNDLHSVTINLPRMFYVNYTVPREDGPRWRKVKRTLPRSHPVEHLYENVIPEDFYGNHVSEITAELCNPDVIGIYETQTPSMFRLLSKLGCVCTVAPEHKKTYGHRETESFDMQHLTFRSLAQCSYLEENSLQYIYLYHNFNSSKEVYGVFIPAQSRAHIFAVDSVRTNNVPNLKTLYEQEHSLADIEPEYLPPKNHEFEVTVETNPKLVQRAVNKLLSQYKDEKRGPTAILVQSANLDVNEWHERLPITDDFPLITIHKSQSESYHVLDWQKVAVKLILQHYLRAFYSLTVNVEQCRYLHVPIGNVPVDSELFACDLFYSRYLARENHVLWASLTDTPDLGGKQTDDKRFAVHDVDEPISLNVPGFYLSVCVDINIQYLVVNSILQGSVITDAEGQGNFDQLPQQSLDSMLQGNTSANISFYDDTALCSSAFRIMKSMLNSWLCEVVKYENQLAADQIEHFHRWLLDPSTLLYDPALKKLVHTITRKVFSQLLNEFKRLGAVVVYADLRRIVINTKKPSMEDALSYTDYILTAINGNQLYKSTAFRFTQAWECLLWMDKANYSGIRGRLTESLAADCKEYIMMDEVDMSEHTEPAVSLAEVVDPLQQIQNRLQSRWNIQHYLPVVGDCQKAFYNIVSSYIVSVFNHLLETEEAKSQSGYTPIRKLNSQKTQVLADNIVQPLVSDFSTAMVQEDIAPRMYQLITYLHQHNFHSDREDVPQFLQLPGSHLLLSNPALQLAKTVCHVLSLDSNITENIADLKLDLLRILNIGQFAADAEFVNPSTSYTLSEMLCTACNTTCDLDICRDITFSQTHQPVKYWSCPSCSEPYSSSKVEEILIRKVQKEVMAYILQDFTCVKCKMVKRRHMDRYCECSGRYTNVMRTEDFKKNHQLFYNIAKHFRLARLQEVLASTGLHC